MVRNPSCSIDGLNKGAWTVLEDKILTDYVKINGEGRWSNVSKKTGLKRCGKSCRLRWMNYLRPDIKRGNISLDEEELIIRLHKLLGNRWSLIAGRLPGRTDNEIKNYWNTNLAKKAQDFSLVPKIERMMETNNLKSLISKEDLVTPHQYSDQNNISNVVSIGPSTAYCNNLVHESSQRTSSMTSEEEKKSNFLMDFNIDDICQILDLDNEGIPDLNNVTQGDENKLLCDEMEENWSGSDCCAKGDIGNDFPSLASFLESEEWIGDHDLNGVREIN